MNKEELQKTAYLAHLKLTAEEESEFSGQLKLIFQYFNRISTIDTQGTKPLVYPLEGIEPPAPAREDQTQLDTAPEELLKIAPDRLGNEYKTPPVVE